MLNLNHSASKMTATLNPLCHVLCSKFNLNLLSKCLFSTKLFCDTVTKPLFYNKFTKTHINTLLWKNYLPKRSITINSRLCGVLGPVKAAEGTFNTGGLLSKQQAQELALKLTSEERNLLLTALQEYQSKIVKDEYLGQLAASRWRSKFGRPSKLPTLGDVDPTGTYCPVPEDWLRRKCVESVAPPTTKELIGLCVANSIPFIGFGFLDNFIMILAGDYIDITLGSYLCISTMAAAALGNTFSDVMGIGSAYYVERLANYIGYQPPKLTPIQLDMPVSRQFGNLGRVIGVTLGCLLGMLPLMFINTEHKEEKHKEEKHKEEKHIEETP